jgi:hypothetical protein
MLSVLFVFIMTIESSYSCLKTAGICVRLTFIPSSATPFVLLFLEVLLPVTHCAVLDICRKKIYLVTCSLILDVRRPPFFLSLFFLTPQLPSGLLIIILFPYYCWEYLHKMPILIILTSRPLLQFGFRRECTKS